MIQEQSHKEGGAQFITTTFREELVRAATKCYGITFSKKVSTIHVISTKKALSIIKAYAAEIGEGTVATRVAEEEEEEEEEEEGGGDEAGGDPMEEGGEEEEEGGA